ncbi:MAG: ATP-dependent DNA helicase RecQ [Flavobacteriaceae bacterium]|nr:ATP-dependent DNA helicase RecQ [Flavobacteriaceae bacterium]
MKKHWGYDEFLPPQGEIIQSILDGKDTFALLPTSGGKSITFQVPAIVLDGVCLVISPLIALMKDQIKNLKKIGVKAETISSELSMQDIQIILDNCRFGGVKLLYISPERLNSQEFLNHLNSINISFIAIDEAHCISEWGHDFRPAYLELKKLKEIYPEKPILALTATATPYIQNEIIQNLHMQNPVIFKRSLQRKNLAYRVQYAEDKLSELTQLLHQLPGSSIVFCRTRKETYEVAMFLKKMGFDADFYHARLSTEEKNKKQKHFIQSNQQILASTNAFGMGIDKPDVRNVFHLSPPASIESYFQEVGRAGRDGKSARGIMLYSSLDKKNTFKQFRSFLPNKKEFLEIIRKLYNYFTIGEFEKLEGQKAFSERKFREQYKFSKGKVKEILRFLEQQKIIEIHHSQHDSLVKILIENRNFQDENSNKGKVLSFLARNYGGIFNDATPIDELYISRHLQLSSSFVKEKLHQLQDTETIFYRDAAIIKISFLAARDDNFAKVSLYPKFENLQRIKWQRLNAMYFYAEDENQCKSRMLLRYFGEKKTQNCGICSYCKSQLFQTKPKESDVLNYLSSGNRVSEEIFSYFADYEHEGVIDVLQNLLDEEKIKFKLPNLYFV